MVFKKIIVQNRYVALETGLDPLPFMANAILNFHFDFLHPSLSSCVGVWWSFPVNTGVHSWEGDVLGVYGQCFPTRPTVQIDRLEPESHFNAALGASDCVVQRHGDGKLGQSNVLS